jgi:hypothetical protein
MIVYVCYSDEGVLRVFSDKIKTEDYAVHMYELGGYVQVRRAEVEE